MKIVSSVWLLAIANIFLIQSANSNTTSPVENILKSEELNSSAQSSEFFRNYRLPNETYPEHYDIKITSEVHLGERAFQGEVTIDIVVVASTNNIVLHARQIEISKVNIVNRLTEEAEELSHEYELEREFLTMKRKSDQQFEAGTEWKLIISYNGQLRDDKRGFFLSNYVDENGKDRYLAATHFESTNARHAFPCYDEPAKRATFTITINHSPDYTAISNMPVNETSSSAGKTVFQTTPNMSTYIVAFVVCDFEYTEVIFHNITLRVYSPSSRKQDHQLGLVSGMLYLHYFAKYFGVDYMLPKLDHVAVPKFKSEGMENWGLAIYPEKNLLLNKKTSSTTHKIKVAENVAHEIAHQWFGDYVTIKWWNNVWLKEAVATMCAYKAMENVFPRLNIWQIFHTDVYTRALIFDADENSKPITASVQKPSDIAALYDDITYNKAASVLRMWENVLGEEVFRRALQNFLKNNQYGAASEKDFITEIEKSVHIANLKLPASISKMMETWIHQSGYPILTVTRNYNDRSFVVKQETFFTTETLKDNKTWYIPVNFAVASNPDFRDTKASHYLPYLKEIKVDAELSSDDWMIFNKGSEYFYRIKYDAKNYELITKALIKQPFEIHLRNRAQLLDDTLELVISNRLNHEVFFEMLTYLRNEDQCAPWMVVNKVIGRYIYLKNVSGFKRFVRYLVGPIFNKLGVNEIPGESNNDKLLRDTVIITACRVEMKMCLVKTNKKLKAHFMENITLEPDLESSIFSWGLMQADDHEFNIVYQMLIESPEKHEDLIFRLSFSQNKRHIRKFISSSIDMSNKLLPQERYDLLNKVYVKTRNSLLVCIEFLIENWDAYGNLKGGYDGFKPLDSDIRNMAQYVLNKKVEKKFLELVAKVKESKHVSKSLESDVKEQITKNYQWLQEHGKPVMIWISQYMCANKLYCKK